MAEAWRRLRARVAERGIGRTLAKAFGDHVFRATTSVMLDYRPEWKAVAPNSALPPAVRFVTIRTPDAVPPLGSWLAARAADFSAMLAAGKIGLFVLHDERAVGCCWIALADHHDARARESYPVPPGEAYHYCLLVDPARRAALALPLCREALALLRGLGIRRQFCVIDRMNRPSFQIHLRFGYRECGVRVRHFHLFGRRWTRLSRYRGTLGLHPRARRA